MIIYKVGAPNAYAPARERSPCARGLKVILVDARFFQDIVTGDEIISDTYNLKEIEDVVYEVDCKMVTKGGVEVNIGANASAEEQEDALDEQTEQVIDVVDGFRMTKMEFGDKKQLAGQMKGR